MSSARTDVAKAMQGRIALRNLSRLPQYISHEVLNHRSLITHYHFLTAGLAEDAALGAALASLEVWH